MTSWGYDVGVSKQFPEVYTRIKKVEDFQLNLHVNCDNKPALQLAHRFPSGVRKKTLDQA